MSTREEIARLGNKIARAADAAPEDVDLTAAHRLAKAALKAVRNAQPADKKPTILQRLNIRK